MECLENKKTKVYISGPITGTVDYQERFARVEKMLTDCGFSVINPAKTNGTLPEDTTYEQYMEMSLHLLEMCDCICMMDNWENSRGANREYGFAFGSGMDVIYESQFYKVNGA